MRFLKFFFHDAAIIWISQHHVSRRALRGSQLRTRGLFPGSFIFCPAVNGAAIEISSDASSPHDYRLFLDASVAELIIDRRHAITTRVYRKPDGPLRLKLTEKDLDALTSLNIWQVQPISPDRLTS